MRKYYLPKPKRAEFVYAGITIIIANITGTATCDLTDEEVTAFVSRGYTVTPVEGKEWLP